MFCRKFGDVYSLANMKPENKIADQFSVNGMIIGFKKTTVLMALYFEDNLAACSHACIAMFLLVLAVELDVVV